MISLDNNHSNRLIVLNNDIIHKIPFDVIEATTSDLDICLVCAVNESVPDNRDILLFRRVKVSFTTINNIIYYCYVRINRQVI